MRSICSLIVIGLTLFHFAPQAAHARMLTYYLTPESLVHGSFTFSVTTQRLDSTGTEGEVAFTIRVWKKDARLVPWVMREWTDSEMAATKAHCITGDSAAYHPHIRAVLRLRDALVGPGNAPVARFVQSIMGTCSGDTVTYTLQVDSTEVELGEIQFIVDPPRPPGDTFPLGGAVFELQLSDFVGDRGKRSGQR